MLTWCFKTCGDLHGFCKLCSLLVTSSLFLVVPISMWLWFRLCFFIFSLGSHGDSWFWANHSTVLPVYPFHHVLRIAPTQFIRSRCKNQETPEFAFPKQYEPSLQRFSKYSEYVLQLPPILHWHLVLGHWLSSAMSYLSEYENNKVKASNMNILNIWIYCSYQSECWVTWNLYVIQKSLLQTLLRSCLLDIGESHKFRCDCWAAKVWLDTVSGDGPLANHWCKRGLL